MTMDVDLADAEEAAAIPSPHSNQVVMRMLADPATAQLPAGHHIRITQTGKMRSWIGHALPWLKLHPEVPLVFHTLPPSHLPTKKAATSDDANVAGPSNPPKASNPSRTFRPVSTITISKLISVIELVKREYQASFSTSELEDGRGRMWQYNVSGDLKTVAKSVGSKGKERAAVEDGLTAVGEGVDHELVGMLEAGGNIKMTHCPYMVIVLSVRPLTHLQATRNVTYQPVLPPRPPTGTKRGKPHPYESQEDKARRLYDAAQARKAAAMPGIGKAKSKGLSVLDGDQNADKERGEEMDVDEDEGEDEEVSEVPEKPE